MSRAELVAFIIASLKAISGTDQAFDEQTPILGKNGALTSIQLVELMLALEDYCQENGREFNWASDAAFSTSNSPYRSVGFLTDTILGAGQ